METRFIYRANAVAVGGYLTAPAPAPIPLQAPLSLPVSGGAGAAECVAFSVGSLVSVRRAATRVAGGVLPNDRGWGTTSEVILEGLSLVGGRVTADRLVGRLTSVHAPETTGPREGRISTAGTRIEGLRVDGFPVSFVDNSKTFATLDTSAAVSDAFAGNRDAFRELALKEFFWSGEVPADAPNALKAVAEPYRAQTRRPNGPAPTLRGLIACSVVTAVKLPREARARTWGNWIGIPGVGCLQLGELLIGSSYRRLTLLRLELDSAYAPPPVALRTTAARKKKGDDDPVAPDVGQMSFGGVETDGTPHP